jgi:hypothetical protein
LSKDELSQKAISGQKAMSEQKVIAARKAIKHQLDPKFIIREISCNLSFNNIWQKNSK